MINLLVGIAMCYVLIKIPFWVLGSIRGSRGSLIGGLVRGVIAYKTFGLLSGRGRRRRGHATATKTPDPYATARTDPRGQYMIPFEGLKRQKPKKPPHQRSAPKAPTPRHLRGPDRQLRLPLDGEWPENKPVLQRDGQYRLAMPVQRQPRPPSSGPPESTAKTDRSGQMVLPLGKQWPENRVRWPKPTKDGQYRLPLDVRRQPRPAEPTHRPATPPRPQTTGRDRDRQLRLPLGQDWPENRPRADRTGQYRLPLNVRRQQPPRTPRPRPATQPRPRPRDRQRKLPLNLPPRPHRTHSNRSSGGAS